MKYLYLALSIIGIIVPYYFGFLIVWETGTFDAVTFLQEATINNSARFLAGDLAVAGLAALVYILYNGRKQNIAYWWVCVLGMFAIGTSFGFPFFLYLQERAKEKPSKS
jgi:hypothetical protein